MEGTQFLVVGVGLGPNHARDTSQRIDVEVALIDQTHREAGHPPAYRIDDVDLNLHHDDAFAIMGQVMSIDMKNRQIFLEGGDILCYEHLVVAKGAQHTYVNHGDPESYRAALQTLSQAIKLRNRIASGAWVSSRSQSPFSAMRSKYSLKSVNPHVVEQDDLEGLAPHAMGSADTLSRLGSDDEAVVYHVHV